MYSLLRRWREFQTRPSLRLYDVDSVDLCYLTSEFYCSRPFPIRELLTVVNVFSKKQKTKKNIYLLAFLYFPMPQPN